MQRHSSPMLLAFEAKQTHAEKCTAALQKRFSKKPKNPGNRYAISKKEGISGFERAPVFCSDFIWFKILKKVFWFKYTQAKHNVKSF